MSNRFQTHLKNGGIKHQKSCPHTPSQNGLAERKHRHVVELSLSMMFQSQVPLQYWVESFFTGNHLINILPSSAIQFKTPYEVLHKKKPDYSYLRVFGSACYPCLRPYSAHKMEPRSLQCVFLGYNADYKGYRCLYPPTGRVYISRHVIFDEKLFPFTGKFQHLIPKYPTALLQAWQQATMPSQSVPPSPASTEILLPAPFQPNPHIPNINVQLPSPANSENNQNNQENISDQEEENGAVIQAVAQPNLHPMTTRAKVGVTKPNPRYALLTTSTPRSVPAALKDPRWTRAMEEEMENQHENKTFHLVPYEPTMSVLGSRWIYREKLNADGSEDKCKARLVVKGNEQEEGVDYLEMFSPVVRTATIRIVLGVATAKKWKLTQLDVKAAFLHGDLNEDIYMTQPQGFEDPDHPSHVCKLDKAIYGLKQAPRAWYDKFTNFILEYGFKCSTADPSLFVYHNNGKSIILLLYVDDIILTGSDNNQIQQLIQDLSLQFSMKDLGSLHYFLGIQVESTPNGLFLHQRKYAEEILSQAGMLECNPMPTLLPLQLFSDAPSSKVLFPQPSYFRSLAGKLQYLTITRPDIQFAVNFVCQRMHAPTEGDFSLLKRILRYLKGTTTYGLHMTDSSSLHVLAFSDSDWAGCKDTRRSTTGFCTYLGSNAVSWSAKRQSTVSRSSTEAEYRALAETSAELTWIANLLKDLHIPQDGPAILYCDNLSAVHLTTNPAFHSRSKHFETDWHYTRERVALGFTETRHIAAAS